MSIPKPKSASRVRYYDGQRLTSQDLQDDVGYEARMRGLHVRALHGVWGISLGYKVIPAKDKKSINVTQGMAYDCSGREIVMSSTFPLDLPKEPRGSNAQAWWFDLLIRYEDQEATKRGLTANRSCSETASSLPNERLALRWSYAGDAPTPLVKPAGFADDVRLGEEIPLARVRVTNQREVAEIDFTVRRVARGLVRPHISQGQARQGEAVIQGSPWHWTAWINTSSGGFNTGSPMYFVDLADHPWLSANSGFASITNALPLEHQRQLLGPFITIKEPSRTGFVLDVRMAAVNIDIFKSMPTATHRSVGFTLPVAVNWLGIEPIGGCQPPMESKYFYLTGLLRRTAEDQWCSES
jgi:hypothetical protein